MTKNVAVILAGCGNMDGAEIHESTMSLLALDQLGAYVQCFAPDILQRDVVNHFTGEVVEGESRNVLVEAARIARGDIKPLAEFAADKFDAVMLPGGFGAAKNLCDFAVAGAECSVNGQVAEALNAMRALGKPIGALCISPVILAKLFEGAKVTLGAECDASKAVEDGMGASHVVTASGQIAVDENLNLVTAACYMSDVSIAQIYEEARAVAEALVERA